MIDNLDYFEELGVSHLYLSPVLKARPGSSHGYDVVDHSQINPELGGEGKYRELIRRAKERGLGIIQDVVPNHMAVHWENWRLMDVLKKGKESKYYYFFDLYREYDKIVLPILEDELDKVISRGLIRIGKDERGEPILIYRDWRLPLSKVLGDLKETLEEQNYRLAYWKEPPSYRRFFDVNELIAINQELDWVFEETHSKILEFDVDGFRVDHVDGLYDPKGYVKRLKEKTGKIVLVEKILAFNEELFEGPDGTTGYDFLNYANLLFSFNEEGMTRAYLDFLGLREYDAKKELEKAKRQVIEELFYHDIKRLADLLGVNFEDLVDYLVCLNKYRTYDNEVVKECDKSGEISRAAKDRPGAYSKLQQFMPAIYAKSYEDTFLYRFNRLIALNEVGSDIVNYYSLPCEEFHRFNSLRISKVTLNATSTHDTKFSEDVRMKIAAISENPEEWERKVKEFHDILNPKVDRNTEYRFYQVLVGSFYEGFTEAYKERIRNYMIKAVREAKQYTSWINPNAEYEGKVLEMVEDAFKSKEFQKAFLEYEGKIRRLGMVKSLSLLALKVLSPGVPDFYQGTETWRFLLTDPDNRTPVDFKALRELLRRSKEFDEGMVRDMNDGRVKMYVTYRLLHLRKARAEEFLSGSYEPLKLQEGLCGFRRGDVTLIVKTMASMGEVRVKLEGEHTDFLTGEKVKGEVTVSDLPRVLIRSA